MSWCSGFHDARLVPGLVPRYGDSANGNIRRPTVGGPAANGFKVDGIISLLRSLSVVAMQKFPASVAAPAATADKAIPLIGYAGQRLTWLGPYLGYELVESGNMNLDAVLAVRFEGIVTCHLLNVTHRGSA